MWLLLLVFVGQTTTAAMRASVSDVRGSVILIPLANAENLTLTSLVNGVTFDLDGDGAAEQVAWTAPDSQIAFLAIDRNGNGQIDNGTELFGNHTIEGAPNGFAALARLAGIKKGSLTADDAFFASLLLWTDRNHNGVSEANEMEPFGARFAAVGLGYGRHNRRDEYGNQFQYRGWLLVQGENRPEDLLPSEHARRQRDIYAVIFVQQ